MNQDRCEGEKEMNQSVKFNEKEKKILEALYNKEGVRNWESMTKQGQREWANLMDGVLTREEEQEGRCSGCGRKHEAIGIAIECLAVEPFIVTDKVIWKGMVGKLKEEPEKIVSVITGFQQSTHPSPIQHPERSQI